MVVRIEQIIDESIAYGDGLKKCLIRSDIVPLIKTQKTQLADVI